MKNKWIVFLIVCLSVTLAVVWTQASSEVSGPVTVNKDLAPESEFGTGCPAVGRNTATEDEIPHWWCWPRENWSKFQQFASQTEVIWEYNETTGEKIGGKVMVGGQPLSKVYSSGLPGDIDETAFYGFNSISPIKYLEGEREGNCGGVSIICYCLFTTQGENVILTSAQTVNIETGEPGLSHAWVEWTENDNQWVIDLGNVIPLEEWYQNNDWTYSWVQWKPGEYEAHRDGTIIYFDS